MTRYLAVGIGAGLVSALLFVSATTGSTLAILLFYVAPLPLYVVGFGWGGFTALIAAATGALAAFLAGSGLPGALYAATIALPSFWLVRLALLSRETPDGVEFYPVGRLVLWTAVLGAVLVAGSLLFLGLDAETIHAQLEEALRTMIGQGGGLVEETDVEAVASFMAVIMPAATASVWTLLTLVNIWLAGRIVAFSGRAPRPWPDLPAMQFPYTTGLFFAAFVVASFAPGLVGMMARLFASSLSLAYLLLGLAIVHFVTRETPKWAALRPLVLGGVYLMLVLLSWTGILIAGLGLAEPLLRLRDKARSRKAPPSNPNRLT